MTATATAAAAKLTARELDALRAELRRELRAEATPRKRTPRPYESPDVAAAATRMTRSLGKRAALDVEALPLLVELRQVVEAALVDACEQARERHGYSWADLASRLGVTRQAAQQRYGRR